MKTRTGGRAVDRLIEVQYNETICRHCERGIDGQPVNSFDFI